MEKNNKKSIVIGVIVLLLTTLMLLGLTYAYYRTRIVGNNSENSISVTSTKLELVYGNDDGSIIGEKEIIKPGKTFVTKTFTVTNNGDETIKSYAVILDKVSITDIKTGDAVELNSTRDGKDNDFDLTITCKNGTTDCNGYADVVPEQNAILVTNSIAPGETHTYSAVLVYQETDEDQSSDMNKNITGKFNIIDTEDTAIIEGTIVNTSNKNYYVQTNSTKRISYIDVNGNYKIFGLELGPHTMNLCEIGDETCESPALTKNITITSGTSANANNATGEITIKDNYKIATINIDVDKRTTEIKENIGLNIPYGTFAYNILNNGAQVLNTKTNELVIDKTYTEKTEITKVSDGTDMTDAGMFTAPDDYGTSYYFRGPVENNYVEFAGFPWRIVRINGDGSVRLILDRFLDNVNIPGTETKVHSNGTGINALNGFNAYVGYMYGIPGSETYKSEHEFTGDKTTYTPGVETAGHSTMKVALDKFYEQYLKTYENYIADTLFCGDKTLADQDGTDDNMGTVETQTGTGNNKTLYAATERLTYISGITSITTAKPTLLCANNANDDYSRYSVNVQTLKSGKKTNGDLTYPIALLSADELVLAGAFSGRPNTNYYLNNTYTQDRHWWTMTPYGSETSYFFEFCSSATDWSSGNCPVEYAFGVRPVINLRSDVLIDSGNGTSGSGAYKVKLAS